MEDPIKLCPFKRDSNGGFGLCSGASCMAYAEFQSVCMSPDDQPKSEPICRLMLAGPHYCGCGR